MSTETPQDGRIRNYYGNDFYGVLLDQTEDGVWYADGHIEPRRMAAAMAKYNRTIIGERLGIDWTYAEIVADLHHRWGVPVSAEVLEQNGWMWGYDKADESTPGAVPITVVLT